MLTDESSRIPLVQLTCQCTYIVSQKTVQNCFCQNFVKCPPIWIIFGRKTAKRLKLCEVQSFSSSPNSRHHTTLLNSVATTPQITGVKLYSRPSTLKSTGANVPIAPMESVPIVACQLYKVNHLAAAKTGLVAHFLRHCVVT